MADQESLTVTLYNSHKVFEKLIEREVSGVKIKQWTLTPEAKKMLQVKPKLTMENTR